MAPDAWGDKRERQYEHIKESAEDRGEDQDTAEEIAARTVNKERARAGAAEEASATSTEDISSGRRGGLRSHEGPGGRTRDQLYEEAKDLGAESAGELPRHHRDPFDRMLVAQARHEGHSLVTRDVAFDDYDVKTLRC